MISTFSLTIYKGISVFCEAFLLFNLLSSFTLSSYEMKLKLKVTKYFHSLNNCIYTWVVFAFLKSHLHFTLIISVRVALSFPLSIRKFLTILTKYLFNIFAILILLSIILSFLNNLTVGLALTLFEERVFMFC